MRNLHMMHAEDCVICGNMEFGYNILFNLYEFLQDKACHPFNLTIKYDGAPAIFCWSKFPGLEKPGISMKGLFNQTPKIFISEKEIEEDLISEVDADLSYKLKQFLKYLPKVPKGEIWQGDILFDDTTIKTEEIEGKKKLMFHPNTIMYAVPDDLQEQILVAKIGVVWHTRYRGKSLQEAYATYDFDEYTYKHKKLPEIFMFDAHVNVTRLGYFSEEEKSILNQRFHRIQEIKTLLDDTEYKTLHNEYKTLILNEDFVTYFKMYQNFIIKERCGELSYDGFKDFIKYKFKIEIETRKSEKGKEIVIERRNDLLTLIKAFQNTFNLIVIQINNFTSIKEIFLNKLNEYKIFDTYLKMKTGEIRKTNQEGFALSDESGNVIKLVDREEFSYANFSSYIVKGWTKII